MGWLAALIARTHPACKKADERLAKARHTYEINEDSMREADKCDISDAPHPPGHEDNRIGGSHVEVYRRA